MMHILIARHTDEWEVLDDSGRDLGHAPRMMRRCSIAFSTWCLDGDEDERWKAEQHCRARPTDGCRVLVAPRAGMDDEALRAFVWGELYPPEPKPLSAKMRRRLDRAFPVDHP